MKRKIPLGLIIAGSALIGVTAMCVLTFIGAFQWLEINASGVNLIANNRYEGTAEETVTFDPGEAVGVRMDWSYGSITLRQTDEDQIRMDLVKTAWSEAEVQADAKAEALTVDVNQEGDWLVFSFEQPDEPNGLVIQDSAEQIDVELYLPEGLDVDLSTWTGTITANGFRGDMTVDNQFGSVYISDHVGALSVESGNGVLELAQIDAGKSDVLFASNFGDITMDDISAGGVEVSSDNGDIEIRGLIASGDCEISGGFGIIQMNTFTCSKLTLKSQNGPMTLENGNVQGDLSARSDFGSLTLTGVEAANYTLESSNGDISADQVAGKVKVIGGFGDVELENGVDVVLDVKNDNGKITYSGSLSAEWNHTVISKFGEVTLRLPESTSLDIDLQTDFGSIDTDFPVTLQGQIDPSSMEGRINEGGSLLRVETENGNIVLQILQ